ncbi:MAG: metal-dependent hydrolase [Acidobacteria bacterium]|nr:metal-dependent hydrolase [Acidobacteriota bacterium]
MDNVCHTLVGIAAARAGLNTKTALATATLAIASNLPDIDVLAFATGIPSVALRRGWTHGVLAQALLPLAFAGVMWMVATRGSGLGTRGSERSNNGGRANFRWLLILSYIGVLSHVFLDYLNTYGVRLLMPFSQQWFYGDSVFIVDVWMWLMLGPGAVLARRGRPWVARAALMATALYVCVMLVSAQRARAIVMSRWVETFGNPPAAMMVGPVPINPFRKAIIVDGGDRYVVGRFHWYPRHISFAPSPIPKNDQGPWVLPAIAQEPDFAAILVWARFPYWELEEDGSGVRVTLRDVRFPRGVAGFSATTYIRKEAHAAR